MFFQMKKFILYTDATNIYGWALSEPLPYGKTEFEKKVKLEDLVKNPEASDISYFVKNDFRCPDNCIGKNIVALRKKLVLKTILVNIWGR